VSAPSISGPSVRITTKRLVLRCWHPEDAASFKKAVDSSLAHLQPWMEWARAEPSALLAIETRLARMRDEFVDGVDWAYAVLDRHETEVLGGIGLHRRGEPDLLEVGYWLRVGATGHGYATEAAGAMTRIAFDEVGVSRLQIRCDPTNARSAGVPARLGYRHVRTIANETATPDGRPRDTMVWELTRREYARVAARSHAERRVDP
jgi:RimJ/RimL family protein N-acetyltransferase